MEARKHSYEFILRPKRSIGILGQKRTINLLFWAMIFKFVFIFSILVWLKIFTVEQLLSAQLFLLGFFIAPALLLAGAFYFGIYILESTNRNSYINCRKENKCPNLQFQYLN